MPDISMCNGNNCELSSTCYRYKAEPSKYRQSYFVKEPNDGLECDYYWEIKTKCYCGHTLYCDCGPETLEETIEIKCEYCHQKNGVHKISCPTNKIQINL